MRDIRPADIATLANAAIGLAAIALAGRGEVHFAAFLVLAGILMDGVDGALARAFGGGPLGQLLDTLADAVTFGVAPAMLIVMSVEGWPGPVLGIFFLSTVLLRLARFGLAPEARFFTGLSSPGGALLVAAVVLTGEPFVAIMAAMAGLLMVSNRSYPKMRGWFGIIAVAAIGATIILGFSEQESYGALATLVLLTVYILLGPWYNRKTIQAEATQAT